MSQQDAVRINYVREFTKLSLWYAHKRFREGDTDFEGMINGRVNIYRNTILHDGKRHPASEDVGPEWAAILNQLKTIFDRHMTDESTKQLEESGLELLAPYLKKQNAPLPLPKDRPYECWTYNYTDRVHIHIFNVYQPKSPLSEMHMPFAASLIRLLRDVKVERPDIESVSCGSWLNSSPPFQALFPEQWTRKRRTAPGRTLYNGALGAIH